MSRRLRRVPPQLAALLGVAAILGVAWSVLLPGFQTPDANSHFAYLQSLTERGELPGDADRRFMSTEQNQGADTLNADQTAARLVTKPEWSAAADERWRTEISPNLPADAREDGGGPNPAATNPPLYYLYAAVPYYLGRSSDLFGTELATRLGSVVCFLVTVLGTWLLAGEVFRRDRLLQTAAAGAVTLLPMVAFMSSSIGPDTLMYALWTLTLWLGVKLLRAGPSPRLVAAFVGVAGLAIVTKATSYAVIPAVVVAVALAVRHLPRRRVTALAGAGLLALAATVGTWFVAAALLDRPAAAQVSATGSQSGALDVRELVSYVWQYYLPRLPFMNDATSGSWPPPAYDVWVKQGWGAFGWLEVEWPGWLYPVLFVLSTAVVAAAVVALVRRRGALSRPVLLFLGVAALGLVAGLHWAEYRSASAGSGAINQGRYLFPIVALAGLTAAQALTAARPERRRAWMAGGAAALFVLHLTAFGLVAVRFYA